MESLTSFASKLPAGTGGLDVAAVPSAARAGAAWRGLNVAVPVAYLAAAMLLTWRLWADPASRMVAGNPHDADLFAWFMRYAATAVRHGHLPALVTTGMNAPAGVNLMWNTPILVPGLLLAPVTGLFGPQVSLTILTTAGFAGSALTLQVVLRRWGVSTGAAVLAGAVYGFSPALLQEALSHYNLQLLILPPLIIDAGLRLAIGHRPGEYNRDAPRGLARLPGFGWLGRVPDPARAGAWLGLLVVVQVFISEEIALSTAMAGLALVLVLALSRPAAAIRRAWPALAGLLSAALVSLALAGHALAVQFYGPLTQHGPVYPLDYYVNDPTSFVTPQSALLFHTAASAATAARYQGGATEYLGYLGWPLLMLLVLAAVASWRRPAGRAFAITFLVLSVCSLGGHLLISGTVHQGVDLPWHWIEELPVVSSALPDRLSILADGVAAVVLAMGIDEARAWLASRHAAAAGSTVSGGGLAGVRWRGLVLAVAVLGCLPLLPRPLPATSTYPLPAGWDGVFAALHVQPGTRVLVVPVPINFLTPAIRWSAESGEPAAMIGGYYLGPGAWNGQPYVDGYGTKPTAWYLDQLWAAGLPASSPYASAAGLADLAIEGPSGPAALPASPSATQIQADLRSWRPGAVVADAAPGSPLGNFLDRLFGPPSVTFRGMTGWRLAART